jgi:glutathione S-transferase
MSRNRVDADLILFELRAIARFIALKAASSFVPTEAHAAARFEQAVSTEAFNFDPYASGIAVQRVSNPRRGGKSDEARVAAFGGALADKLEGYERIPSCTEYLGGNGLTIADLFTHRVPRPQRTHDCGSFSSPVQRHARTPRVYIPRRHK